MSGIQERLDTLKPHVVGIRNYDNKYIVEAIFKKGWVFPPSDTITMGAVNEEAYHFVLYSDSPAVDIDGLLDFVEATIQFNVEREQKYALLKERVKELTALFKDTSLVKLKTLRFTMSDEDDNISAWFNGEEHSELDTVLDPDPEPLVGEPTSVNVNGRNIELPPKREKIELEDYSLPEEITDGECDCGPEQACPKCIDDKTLV